MRRHAFAGFCLGLLAIVSAEAQPYDLAVQQSTMQGLLNDAITAIRNDDMATACQRRSQALAILNTNYQGFVSVYPTNNWSDLQASLQGSVNECVAKGRL
jgi:hypothetical protein